MGTVPIFTFAIHSESEKVIDALPVGVWYNQLNKSV